MYRKINRPPTIPVLSDYEEVAVPFDDVMRKILQAKKYPKLAKRPQKEKPAPKPKPEA